MPRLIVRAANPSDLEAVMTVENEAFDPRIRETREVFAQRLETFPGGFFVLEADGKVGGYACAELWKRKDDPEPGDFALGHRISERHRSDGDEFYVSSFGVLDSLRGTGAGRFLWTELVRAVDSGIRPASWILLVSQTWSRAIGLYERSGFSEIRRFPAFFSFSDGSRADGIVMRRGPRQ